MPTQSSRRQSAPRRRGATIAFIGGGNMASALIGGLLQQGWPRHAISAVEIARPARDALRARYRIHVQPQVDADVLRCRCIVLAVKPQQMREAAAAIRPHLGSQLVISIAAGIRAADLARWLGGYRRIVRVMPNTPALVRAGISGLHAGNAVSRAGRALAQRVLGSVGATVWVEREEQLDAVTAVSGSGPAYVFYFIEALERAAVGLGLGADTARRLALETFAGAARLAVDAREPPGTLRARVTSRGGTTERALAALEGERVREAIVRAVHAAAERARELGDELGRD